MIVYRDDKHLTATYANWLTPVIAADLAVATHLTITPPSAGTGTGAGTGAGVPGVTGTPASASPG